MALRRIPRRISQTSTATVSIATIQVQNTSEPRTGAQDSPGEQEDLKTVSVRAIPTTKKPVNVRSSPNKSSADLLMRKSSARRQRNADRPIPADAATQPMNDAAWPEAMTCSVPLLAKYKKIPPTIIRPQVRNTSRPTPT